MVVSNTHIVTRSDLPNGLPSMHDQHSKARHTLILEIIQELHTCITQHKNITLARAPRHSIISGNDRADKLQSKDSLIQISNIEYQLPQAKYDQSSDLKF